MECIDEIGERTPVTRIHPPQEVTPEERAEIRFRQLRPSIPVGLKEGTGIQIIEEFVV